MASVTLSQNTQNLINYALANGPGTTNINYRNAYAAISSDIAASGTINSGVASWFANAGAINSEQYLPNGVGAYVWSYTTAAAASEGAAITTTQLQAASNLIATTVFNTLKSSNFSLNDQGNFTIENIVSDDAGKGIGYLQSQFPSANLDFAIWAGRLTADTSKGLGDTNYLQTYGLTDLWVGSRDCNAILSGAASGAASAYYYGGASAVTSNLAAVDGDILAACTFAPNPATLPYPGNGVGLYPVVSSSETGSTFKLSFADSSPLYGIKDNSSLTFNTSTKTWTDATTDTNTAGTVLETDSLSSGTTGLSATIAEPYSTETSSVTRAGAETITMPGGSNSGAGVIDAVGATVDEGAVLPRAGADSLNGANDIVNLSTGFFGKLGSPYSTANDFSGTGTTFSDPGESPLAINVESNNSSFTTDYGLPDINGGNYTGLTITVDQGGTGTVSGIGAGSTLNMNSDSDTATVAAGDKVNFGADTANEVLDASSAKVTEGASADANIKGSNDTIALSSKDNIDANGSGDVVSDSGSGNVIDLQANEKVTITGSGEDVVGTTGDTIDVTGTSDHIYADTSTIEISGADTGDIVYGVADTGDTGDWGGYVYDPGGYGGYGGGGYYAVTARRRAAAGAASSRGTPENSGGVGIESLAADDRSLGRNLTELYTRKSATLPAALAHTTAVAAVDKSTDAAVTTQASTHLLIHAMSTWPEGQSSATSNALGTTHPLVSEHLLLSHSVRALESRL